MEPAFKAATAAIMLASLRRDLEMAYFQVESLKLGLGLPTAYTRLAMKTVEAVARFERGTERFLELVALAKQSGPVDDLALAETVDQLVREEIGKLQTKGRVSA